jgi:hypothetical protein
MLERLGVANSKQILQHFTRCCPKLYPCKLLQRFPTKKVAISAIATILGLLQHFSGIATGSKINSLIIGIK